MSIDAGKDGVLTTQNKEEIRGEVEEGNGTRCVEVCTCVPYRMDRNGRGGMWKPGMRRATRGSKGLETGHRGRFGC